MLRTLKGLYLFKAFKYNAQQQIKNSFKIQGYFA